MSTPLWERGGVSAAVAELLDAARAGRGGVLFIEGEAGLGKSSVLDSARAMAQPDLRVGLGQGDAMEMSLPFGVLDQALATLGDRPRQRARNSSTASCGGSRRRSWAC